MFKNRSDKRITQIHLIIISLLKQLIINSTKFFQHNIILPMALHINLQQLPQISLSKLQESCATHKNILNKHNCCDQLSQAHTKGIMVQSPFYERNQDHKGPCTCAYHRMKRYKEVATVFKGSTNTKARDEIQKYKQRIAAAVRSSIDVKKEDRKAILKVKAKAIFRTTDNSFEQKSESYSARQRMKSELDDYNYLFEQILKKRMAPMMDKEKTSNLINFIKITSKINPNYLKKVRELIFHYLDKVVQKISYTKLVEEEGNAQIQKKTAHIINGKRQLAAEFIKGIHKSIKDMEKFIIESAQNNFKNEEQQLKKEESHKKICSLNKLESGHSSKNIKLQADNDDKKNNERIQGWQQENQGDISIHKPIKQKQNRQTGEDQKIGIPLTNNTEEVVRIKQPFIPTKRSNVSFNNQLKVLFGGDSIVTEIKEQEQVKKLNVIDESKTNSYKSSSIMNKTKRENDEKNVQDTRVKTHYNDDFNNGWNTQQDKIQKQKDIGISQKSLKSDISERKNPLKIVPKDKKKKKKGKGKLPQKKDLFSSIDYLNLLTEQEFQMIKNLLRDDYYLSDKEKMNRVFNIIERRISGNPQYFNDFVMKFENLMTPQQLELLKQKYKSSEFNKMLTKLTKQVDLCLIQIKHADDLIWRQDFIQNKGDDKQSTFEKKTFCLDINNADESLMTQFNKFTIVQNNPIQVKTQSPCVSQKQIGQIYLQDIINVPSIKQSVRVSKIKTKPTRERYEKQEKEMDYLGGVVDQENHKKILRYLKVKNPLVFHKVRLSVKDTLDNSMALEK